MNSFLNGSFLLKDTLVSDFWRLPLCIRVQSDSSPRRSSHHPRNKKRQVLINVQRFYFPTASVVAAISTLQGERKESCSAGSKLSKTERAARLTARLTTTGGKTRKLFRFLRPVPTECARFISNQLSVFHFECYSGQLLFAISFASQHSAAAAAAAVEFDADRVWLVVHRRTPCSEYSVTPGRHSPHSPTEARPPRVSFASVVRVSSGRSVQNEPTEHSSFIRGMIFFFNFDYKLGHTC